MQGRNGGKDGRDDRQARLAQALRENLRRRKAQARARAGAKGAPEPPENRPDSGTGDADHGATTNDNGRSGQ